MRREKEKKREKEEQREEIRRRRIGSGLSEEKKGRKKNEKREKDADRGGACMALSGGRMVWDGWVGLCRVFNFEIGFSARGRYEIPEILELFWLKLFEI